MHQVAQIIFQQLGGNRFKAMTGAYSFTGSSDTLSFRIPQKNRGRFGGVRITLTSADLYDVHFVRLNGFTPETVSHKGIYADQLERVFTEETRLLTRLSPIQHPPEAPHGPV